MPLGLEDQDGGAEFSLHAGETASFILSCGPDDERHITAHIKSVQEKFDEPAHWLPSLFSFFREELMPYPGRLPTALRLIGALVLALCIDMTFDLPIMGPSLYMVFFVSHESPAKSLRSFLMMFVVTGLMLLGAFAIASIPGEQAAVRFVGCAVVIFSGMFFSQAAATQVSRLFLMASIFGVIFIQQWDSGYPAEATLEGMLYAWLSLLTGLAQCRLLKEHFHEEMLFMKSNTSPDPWKVLEFFQQLTLENPWLKALQPPGPAFSRGRIYTLGVVIRLMMVQRLLPNFSLSRAVQHLLQTQEAAGCGVGKRISPRAGAYCRARHLCAGRKHPHAATYTGFTEGVPTAPQSEGDFALASAASGGASGLLAVAAYNLVRAVICLAAETFSAELTSARHRRQWNALWDRIIDLATSYILPNRSKPRSYPRPVWPKPKSFPANHAAVP